jgi:catechol 2,3-dioxygenase-like lactoylglutathione lyase family enzyme
MLNIRHTGIVVSDAEKSIDFYTKLLGFEIKKDMLESGDYIDNFSDLKDVVVRTIKMTLEN